MSNRAFIKEQKRDYRNKAITELSEFRKHYVEFGQHARNSGTCGHKQYNAHEIKQEAQTMVKRYANKRDAKIISNPLKNRVAAGVTVYAAAVASTAVSFALFLNGSNTAGFIFLACGFGLAVGGKSTLASAAKFFLAYSGLRTAKKVADQTLEQITQGALEFAAYLEARKKR